jgi:hypothetical protein
MRPGGVDHVGHDRDVATDRQEAVADGAWCGLDAYDAHAGPEYRLSDEARSITAAVPLMASTTTFKRRIVEVPR